MKYLNETYHVLGNKTYFVMHNQYNVSWLHQSCSLELLNDGLNDLLGQNHKTKMLRPHRLKTFKIEDMNYYHQVVF